MYAKMLTTALIAAAGLLHVPAFAQHRGGEVGDFAGAAAGTSSLTRAAVHDAVLQAQRNGTLPSYGEGADTGRRSARQPADAPVLTRAEVRADLVQALRDGSLPGHGEGDDVGAAPVADGGSAARTRAEVRAEAVRALRSGQIPGGEV